MFFLRHEIFFVRSFSGLSSQKKFSYISFPYVVYIIFSLGSFCYQYSKACLLDFTPLIIKSEILTFVAYLNYTKYLVLKTLNIENILCLILPINSYCAFFTNYCKPLIPKSDYTSIQFLKIDELTSITYHVIGTNTINHPRVYLFFCMESNPHNHRFFQYCQLQECKTPQQDWNI